MDKENKNVTGDFLNIGGEDFYVIRHVDKMAPFFISVVSSGDHWLYVSSTGGLTAGRVSPESPLFPYITVDKIHESALHTGSKTLVKVHAQERLQHWEPFNREHDERYHVERNLYKNTLGNRLRFEEINHDLELAFRCTWSTSDSYGFVRQCELENLKGNPVSIELLDGLQNVMAAGTPRFTQTNHSNLADAYKWTELDTGTGLALFTLYSGITDRAEPFESLRANTVFCLGLEGHQVSITPERLAEFRAGSPSPPQIQNRGQRGAYYVTTSLALDAAEVKHWALVADVEQNQKQVIALQRQLAEPKAVSRAVAASIEANSDELARIVAVADGFQAAAETPGNVHHYANVLFNVMRGGIFNDQYNISADDFAHSIRHFNHAVYTRHEQFLRALPPQISLAELKPMIDELADPQLTRLSREYLPITFGRRHGDPSRPWNEFTIRRRDASGKPLLSYEGNWRDIFQNWEALAFSYPEFIENIITKFVNASTPEGYNPYRITNNGIDWEVEIPDDPWSYIGYWGDHQIIYLLKLLEHSRSFHPDTLKGLLHKPLFSYANVPYRIKPFAAQLEDSKSTVTYDQALDAHIQSLVEQMGADGKLVLDNNGEVYQVNLLEKLLIPLLSKLGNLVIDGGIWLNTQRPEWNDANNALVGHGLSMVTLYYLRRYVTFLAELLEEDPAPLVLSQPVNRWLLETTTALQDCRPYLDAENLTDKLRYDALVALGEAASRYRSQIYSNGVAGPKVEQDHGAVLGLLHNAMAAIDHSIAANRRADGLYHAYNLVKLRERSVSHDTLYPMLEGQVAVLSSGCLSPAEAVAVIDALFASDIYREDQHSFMLYPDRKASRFLEKNRVPEDRVATIPLLQKMEQRGDERLIMRDADGCYRFNADFVNKGALDNTLDELREEYADDIDASRDSLHALYEEVFNHRAFTGRSGGMFGFEGLGSIYWHMVSKLLLAVQENFFSASGQPDQEDFRQRLGAAYYRVRAGIGFNKTPAEYGAFPTDPYSHTPGHAGARQPGMTGQVKEEVLTRFGELGVRMAGGIVHFTPELLRRCEFRPETSQFRYLDLTGHWQTITVPGPGLAFTWCQVPIVYELDEDSDALVVTWEDGAQTAFSELSLPVEISRELFKRNGRVQQLNLRFSERRLFDA